MPTPRLMRTDSGTSPLTARLPNITSGVCRRCGVVNPQAPEGHFQYEYCPHFKGLGLIRCVYCDPSKDPNEVIRMSDMNVAYAPESRPDDPVIMAWCDSYDCSKKHKAKYDRTS